MGAGTFGGNEHMDRRQKKEWRGVEKSLKLRPNEFLRDYCACLDFRQPAGFADGTFMLTNQRIRWAVDQNRHIETIELRDVDGVAGLPKGREGLVIESSRIGINVGGVEVNIKPERHVSLLRLNVSGVVAFELLMAIESDVQATKPDFKAGDEQYMEQLVSWVQEQETRRR